MSLVEGGRRSFLKTVYETMWWKRKNFLPLTREGVCRRGAAQISHKELQPHAEAVRMAVRHKAGLPGYPMK